MTTKLAASTAIGISGTGTIVVAATYNQTLKTILDVSSNKVFALEEETETWTTLSNNLKNNSSSPRTTELVNIKNDSNSDRNKLKEWCFKSYKETYKSLFQSANEELKTEVETFCFLTIKQKLGNEGIYNVENNSDDDAIKSKISTIKSEQEGDLVKELKEIRDSTDENNNLTKLKNWCKEKYDEPYLEKESIKWKNIEKFCKKSS